jgi:hypothetical protein
MKKLAHWFVLFAAALLLAGCGGGSSGGGGASGGINMFMTDDLDTGISAVWVKIYRVELESQGGGRTVVFDDANGKVFNLRALNDGSPRYAFLGRDGVPAGTYTGMRFTLDKDVRVVPVGSSTGNLRSFADVYLDPGDPSRALLTMTFTAPKTISPGSMDIVADFVLATWTENGLKIENALVAEGGTGGISNPGRHDEDDFKGTVSDLAGSTPNFTFNVTTASGVVIPVSTNTSTSFMNHNGTPNPVLANGKRVEIRGTFSPTDGRVLATSVKIKSASDNDGDDPHEAKGVASNISSAAGTFDVELGEAEGFIPTETVVHVTTSATTQFFTDRGVLISQSSFFDLIAAGNVMVEAEGVWTEGTNTLAAVKVKIEDEDDDHNAEAKGSPNTIDEPSGTFRIQLTEWEGFAGSAGMQVNVVTTGGTVYENDAGEQISKATFFAALATSPGVKVEGLFVDGTITASKARLRASTGGNAEAKGSVSNINVGSLSFDLTITEWEGFSGSPNMVVHVTTTIGAEFRNADGDLIDSTAFFALLEAGTIVEVKGPFNSGTTTIASIRNKIDD